MTLASLGLDLGIIAGIICMTKVLTTVIDPERKLERWYPLLPLFFGVAITIPLFWSDGALKIVVKAFVYGAVAAYLYKTGKTMILGD